MLNVAPIVSDRPVILQNSGTRHIQGKNFLKPGARRYREIRGATWIEAPSGLSLPCGHGHTIIKVKTQPKKDPYQTID
jgi:hypothetical protein